MNIHEFVNEPLPMEGKYAVKLSITDLIKISRKWRKRYNGQLWKIQMWSDSSTIHVYANWEHKWGKLWRLATWKCSDTSMTWQYWSVWSEDVIMVFALVDLSVDSVDHDPHQSLDNPGGWTLCCIDTMDPDKHSKIREIGAFQLYIRCVLDSKFNV